MIELARLVDDEPPPLSYTLDLMHPGEPLGIDFAVVRQRGGTVARQRNRPSATKYGAPTMKMR